MARSGDSVPLPRPIGQALRDDHALASLTARLQRSQACLAAVLPALPPALRPHLLAGPWDAQGWTLMTRQAAALTKLRQLLPVMKTALERAGLGVPLIRLHVLLPR